MTQNATCQLWGPQIMGYTIAESLCKETLGWDSELKEARVNTVEKKSECKYEKKRKNCTMWKWHCNNNAEKTLILLIINQNSYSVCARYHRQSQYNHLCRIYHQAFAWLTYRTLTKWEKKWSHYFTIDIPITKKANVSNPNSAAYSTFSWVEKYLRETLIFERELFFA